MPIAYLEALALIRAAAREPGRPMGREFVPLSQASGRIVDEALVSTERLPPFANSAVDGFALRSAETASASPTAPVMLRGWGTVSAGDAPRGCEESPGACQEIMTGAPIPLTGSVGNQTGAAGGYDAIVKIEDVSVRRGEGGAYEITLTAPVTREENWRDAGEDFEPGMALVSAGQRIHPEHLLALAALGFDRIPVRAVPRALVISTGKELAASGQAPRLGEIRNSTAPYLLAALAELGVSARFAGAVADEPGEFVALFRRCLAEKPDLIITTGAVSMGQHDFIPVALRDLGATPLFHKVAVRPGKPVLAAAFSNGPVVFGLPGNPVSTAVSLRFLVEPFLRALQGCPDELPIRAQLTAPVSRPEGVRCFLKARILLPGLANDGAGNVRAEILAGQASFMVSPLLQANGWVVLPEGPEGDAPLAALVEGRAVDFYPLVPERSWT